MPKRVSDLKKLKLSGKNADNGGRKENKTGIFSFLNNALHFIIYDDDIVISKSADAGESEEYEEDENEKVKTFKELYPRGGEHNNAIQFFKASLSGDEYVQEGHFTLNSGFRTNKKLKLNSPDGNLYGRYTYRITKQLKYSGGRYPVEEVFDEIKSRKQKSKNFSGTLKIKDNKVAEEIYGPDSDSRDSEKKIIDLSSAETTEFKTAREKRKISYSFGISEGTPSSAAKPAAEEKEEAVSAGDEISVCGEYSARGEHVNENNTALSQTIIQRIKKARTKIFSPSNTEDEGDTAYNGESYKEDEEEDGENEYESGEEKFGYLFSSFQNKKKLIAGIQRLFIVFFALIAGSVSMPFGINPLGLALICAADRYIFYIYAGLALSLIPQAEYTALFLILYSSAAVIKYFLKYRKQKAKTQMLASSISFRNLEKDEKQKILNMFRFNDSGTTVVSILLNTIASCLLGIARLLFSKSFVYSEIIQIMLFILVGMLFTYLYSGLFEVGTNNKALEKAGICAVIFTAVYKLAPVYFVTLSVGYIVSFIITLCAANSTVRIKEINGNDDTDFESDAFQVYDSEIARKFTINVLSNDGTMSNMTKGAMVGIICGIALGDTAAAVTLAVCGLISGLFFNQSAALAIIAGMISAISYSIYIAGIDALQYYIINMAVAMTFFIPLNKVFSSFMNAESQNNIKKLSPQREKGILLTELPVKRLDTLSDAFSNLSVTFDELADKLKYPSKSELMSIIESAVEPNCAECVNCNVCNIKIHTNMKKIKVAIADILARKGRLDISEGTVPSNLLLFLKCEMRGEIVKKINTLYRKRTEENINNDKTALFASNFRTISGLLDNSRNVGKEDIFFQQEMSERIYLRLGNMGIECENVIVLGKRRYKVYIFGVKMSDYAGTVEEICGMFENICGTAFAEPEYIVKENFITMKVESKEKYKIYTMQASRSAAESENITLSPDGSISRKGNADPVNGDSSSYFSGDDGLYYSVISDGMGSGRQAAVASKLTVLMLEKLLAAGNVKDLTLEMINNLLLSKNDECFATVDLFEADLVTGQATFIKAGAAPSFVIRGGRIFKIQSSTVPAGILPRMNAEKTKFQLENGDYIIMFTDGIVSTFEESAWLLSMLGEVDGIQDFKKFMADILNTARGKNARIDDMSIQITRVLEV